MADVHSKKVRSYNMSQIKGKNTKPEIIVRQNLFKKGFRFRVNVSSLPGKPDIVLPKYKTIIFVNGCFWHGHMNCEKFVVPKTNTEWWLEKIKKNKERDNAKYIQLSELGWRILIVWECELKKDKLSETIDYIINKLIR